MSRTFELEAGNWNATAKTSESVFAEVWANNYQMPRSEMKLTALDSTAPKLDFSFERINSVKAELKQPSGESTMVSEIGPNSKGVAAAERLLSYTGANVSHASFIGDRYGSWLGTVVGGFVGGAIGAGAVIGFEYVTNGKYLNDPVKAAMLGCRLGVYGGMIAGSIIGRKLTGGKTFLESMDSLNYYDMKHSSSSSF